MSFRRMLPFLLLNILVSAAVVLAVLWWWDGREPESVAAVAPVQLPQVEQAPGAEQDIAGVQPVEQPVDESAPDSNVHVVRAGDTLGQISLQYDVPVDAIMAANGIDNPNFLAVGQELVIPEEGAPLPEPPGAEDDQDGDEGDGTVISAELPTPIPTEPAAEGEVSLVIADVVAPGQLSTEAIQIINNGGRQASLAEWKLTDQLGNTYTFGQLTLFGDGAGIFLHTASGQDSATDLYWGLEEAIWNSGDRVVLYDDAGTVRAEFQIP